MHGTFPVRRVGGPVRDGVAGGQGRMVGEGGWLGGAELYARHYIHKIREIKLCDGVSVLVRRRLVTGVGGPIPAPPLCAPNAKC